MNLDRYGPTKRFENLCNICVKRYGSSARDVVVWVMDNNPGIERYGIVLPVNINLYLPDLPAAIANSDTTRQQIFLWD